MGCSGTKNLAGFAGFECPFMELPTPPQRSYSARAASRFDRLTDLPARSLCSPWASLRRSGAVPRALGAALVFFSSRQAAAAVALALWQARRGRTGRKAVPTLLKSTLFDRAGLIWSNRTRTVVDSNPPMAEGDPIRIIQSRRWSYWDNLVSRRRLNPNTLTREDAIEKATALARAEMDKLG